MKKIIRYAEGVAGFFLTKQPQGDFAGSILYKVSGEWPVKSGDILNFDVKTFYAGSKEEVERSAKQWFTANVASEYTIEDDDGMDCRI